MTLQTRRGPKRKLSKTHDAATLVRTLVSHGWKWAAAELAVQRVTGVSHGNTRRYLAGPIQPVLGCLDDLATFALLHHGWIEAARREGFPKLLTEPRVSWLGNRSDDN